MSDLPLQGKTALITGASSGIGEATARSLASAGATIALVARRLDRLETLAAKIEKETGRAGTVFAVEADLSTEAGVNTAVDAGERQLGRIDLLANIAGIMLVAPIMGTDASQWQRMVNINLMGLMWMAGRVAPGMVERGSGHIVNVSSLAARSTAANFGVYSATKFAVAAFTETLRKELLGSGVRTTEILPGIVESELVSQIEHDDIRKGVEEWVSSVSPLSPEDIADAVLYAVTRPPNVAVSEMVVRPINEEL